ncbi:hypothetical protein M409DRAFT_65191 [Zasmidium cellare ATCC 36951]|uniref:Zinc/iron permease n=1 Tax=Zasmidium cellare ATCC 36951 TaxID=1080233 RepID=A0A6A6CRN5_ZASCE|nr:uncharacterized protein M409DRAFT_65191 [Zasmidium cellare ATCC 36951]KAF2168800.1 hypothetical protein M409DRAFT_65191 [Zasmidium cellare ATCC 36951]
MNIRRSQCGSTDAAEEYDLGLHIFAVFLILTCGTFACSFPVLVKAFPKLAISQHALFISKHFGTGVLIALAFAHLLPTAFENLWNECLPYFWTEGYDAMPGFIAMVAALAVILVEMGFSLFGIKHSHDHAGVTVQEGQAHSSMPNGHVRPRDMEQGRLQRAQDISTDDVESESTSLLPHPKEQRMILQCLLLEAGILFHSVFIGLSISISTGTTFIALMVAIAFHQIFEGLALGARIAAIPSLRISSFKPWAMSLAYGLTCPLGQAIGLGLRTTYDPEGETALLVVGIANAISAGMIMYAGLVQLLGEDLLSEKSYRILSLRARAEAVVALLFGCGLMAMIAIWA